MRILHVVGDSKFGGASRIVMALARDAFSRGWSADVLTTDPVFQQALNSAGLPVVDLDVARRALNPFVDLRGLVRLARYLKKSRYDVVHTHTSKGGFIGRIAACMAGVPCIMHTAHGFAIHETSPARHRVPYAVLESFAALFCDRIVCVSEFHRDWGIQLGIGNATKTIAIVNGIPPSRVAPTVSSSQVRGELGVGADQLLAFTPGRLFAQKGLESLLQAVAQLPAEYRCRTRFVLAGDGPLRPNLEGMVATLGIQESVVFTGFRQDVANLLAAADFLILPSVREGLSIALLEGIAAGKAIIATTIGSNREVGAKKNCLVLVSPDNVRELRDAICGMCTDADDRARLAAAAYETYKEEYTEDRMLMAYAEVYRSLTHDNARHGRAVRAAA